MDGGYPIPLIVSGPRNMYSLILFFPLDFFFLLPTDIVGGNGELVSNVSDGTMDNDEECRPHLHQPQLI